MLRGYVELQKYKKNEITMEVGWSVHVSEITMEVGWSVHVSL